MATTYQYPGLEPDYDPNDPYSMFQPGDPDNLMSGGYVPPYLATDTDPSQILGMVDDIFMPSPTGELPGALDAYAAAGSPDPVYDPNSGPAIMRATDGMLGTAATGSTAPTGTDYSQWGSYQTAGWDPSKIEAGHTSPKYQIGRTLSNFDPTQGITPELLAALNALGLGTFSGSGQNLSITGADPEFGYDASSGDIIRGFQGGSGTDAAWQFGLGDGALGSGGSQLGQFAPSPTASFTGMTSGVADGGRANPNEDPFAAMGGGVYIESTGQWVPKDHPMAALAGPQAATATQGAQGSVPTQPGGGQAPGAFQPVYDMISNLLQTNGGFNQGLVDQRLGAARDTLERQRSAESDTLSAQLAERGLLGSGAESESLGLMGERLGTQYGQQVSDIYNEEFDRADTRMLEALALGAGLSKADADRLVSQFIADTGRMQAGTQQYSAETDRTVGLAGVDATNRATDVRERLGLSEIDLNRMLGLGGLDLERMGLEQNYNLGMGQLGLGQNRLGLDSRIADDNTLLGLLDRLGLTNRTGTDGYI